MSILIKNAQIIDSVKDFQGTWDVLIRDGEIAEIGRNLDCNIDQVIDAKGLAVLPGFVDMHCHLREPGLEYKETVASGSAAAARGGYTTICCMPNTRPVIDSEESLSMLTDIIKRDALVNVFPIAAISVNQKGEALTDMVRLKECGAVAFSDDGQPVYDSGLMESALEKAKQHELLLIDHCEAQELVKGGVINQGEKSAELGLQGISNLSEELPIERDVKLADKTDSRVHIAHVSTAGAVDIIRQAKVRGIKVTCEATPHHIALSEVLIKPGYTDCKVNPPLRSDRDREAVKAGLIDGTIDVIATDHAPHHEEDKGEDFYKAAFGISGIETAFSVCYTELAASGLLSMKELVCRMSLTPSRILGIDKGRLDVGKAADLTIVDLNKTVIVDKGNFVSKGKNTPFHGRSYKGEVIYTIVKGEIVFKKEEKQ
ncbi:MAG: dihydroorotase, multifunctional complex type [Clostridia bacterium]|nr:dihydroorotase, multifunctional complex type [Clostridia bacterium]